MAMLRIYYLGSLNIPAGSETGFDITSGQETFRCPPVGDFIEVPDYVGRDIMNKYGTDVFNTNQQLAKEVAAGKVRFERKEENGQMIVKEILSDDEILARAAAIQKQKEEAAKESEKSDEDDEETAEAQTSEPKSEDSDESEKETKKPTRRRKKKG